MQLARLCTVVLLGSAFPGCGYVSSPSPDGSARDTATTLQFDPILDGFYSQEDFLGACRRESAPTFVLSGTSIQVPGYYRTREVYIGLDSRHSARTRFVDSRGHTITQASYKAEKVEPIEYWASAKELEQVVETESSGTNIHEWVCPDGVGLVVVFEPDGHLVLGFQAKPDGVIGLPTGPTRKGVTQRLHAMTSASLEVAVDSYAAAVDGTIEVVFEAFIDDVYASSARIHLLPESRDDGPVRLLVSRTAGGRVVVWTGKPRTP